MRFFRKSSGDPLIVSMCGVKLGDRLLILGCSDVVLIAALAAKVGLTGRAVIVDESDEVRNSAAMAVEKEGALVESFGSSFESLPFEDHAFDVVIMRNVLSSIPMDHRAATVRETTRVVRPGGRCIVINDARRGSLAGLVGRPRDDSPASGPVAVTLLTDAGFRAARTLAEREGLVFVEGVKPGQMG